MGRGPGSKDVGSPLDAEEISVTLSLGHTAFAGSCSCPQGLRSSRLPKAEAAGRGGPWGKSRDLGHTETVGAGGSCFEIKRKPRHKNKCLKKKIPAKKTNSKGEARGSVSKASPRTPRTDHGAQALLFFSSSVGLGRVGRVRSRSWSRWPRRGAPHTRQVLRPRPALCLTTPVRLSLRVC